jgi:hypothetical protein
MRIKSVLLFVSALITFGASSAFAGPILVQNGNFELTSAGGNKKVNGTNIEADRTTLTGWTSSENGSANGGYNFVLNGATATTSASALRLEGGANGYSASPTGGNFFASDSQYHPGVLSQLINGLTIGTSYMLTFDFALAQQTGYTGVNTDNYWQVGFGKATQNSTKLTIADNGFSGWKTATMAFTATSASEMLSFLARGTAPGAPPFMLLDNVALNAAQVPEPATWTMLLGGLALIGFMARRRRNAQI